MGGIAGQIRFDGRAVSQAEMAAACQRQARRIRGAWDVFRSDSQAIAVGSERHQTSGDSLGKDPQTGLVVAFEGEIYNQAALAEMAGTAGCTGAAEAPANTVHVLAAGYRRWGAGLANRLDGDFALVIWDPEHQCAYFATDGAGVRPLFYVHEAGVHFSFASEVAALADLLGRDARLPESRVVEQLVEPLEILEYGDSPIRGLERLRSAHCGTVRSRHLEIREYWSPGDAGPPALKENDVAGWLEGFDWHLQRAVEKRASGRGEDVGVMFSGGLDSSSVLALISEAGGGHSIPTFSLVDSRDPDCPETRAIEAMNRHCRTAPVRVDLADCTQAAFQARQIIAAAPRFLSGRGAFLHLNYARAAAQGVHSMMDGLDADALLSHSGLGEWLIRQGKFREFRTNARQYKHLRGWESADFNMARSLLRACIPPVVRRQMTILRAQSPRSHSLGNWLLSRQTIERFALQGRWDQLLELSRAARTPGNKRMRSSMASIVTRDGIARSNVRAAQHGVQLRHPFMDRALLDFCAWLPLDLRMRDGWTKWIMRKAMSPHLPHDVAWRSDKTHIGGKFDRMVLQPILDRLVLDLDCGAAAVQQYVNVAAVQSVASEWQQGQISAVWRLTPILLLEHWLQHNQDKVDWGH